MSQQAKYHGGNMDSLKWIIVFALAAFCVVANHVYSDQSILIRTIGIVVAIAIASFVALRTNKGKKFWQFALEARTELRKVVWPSRQETIQTTLIVLAIVSIVGLILWGVDAVLLKIVATITGYGAQ